MVDKQEIKLVNKAVESEMQAIKARRIKTKSIDQIKEKYDL